MKEVEKLEEFVCDQYMVNLEDIMRHHRSNDESEARMVLMFLLFRYTILDSKEIGARYNRKEGSFTHAFYTMRDRYKVDKELQSIVKRAESFIGWKS